MRLFSTLTFTFICIVMIAILVNQACGTDGSDPPDPGVTGLLYSTSTEDPGQAVLGLLCPTSKEDPDQGIPNMLFSTSGENPEPGFQELGPLVQVLELDLLQLLMENEDPLMTNYDLAFFLATHGYDASPKEGHVELRLQGRGVTC